MLLQHHSWHQMQPVSGIAVTFTRWCHESGDFYFNVNYSQYFDLVPSVPSGRQVIHNKKFNSQKPE